MTVGQMYENRRTHKVGVVESINEKFKTILMRDKEGNSFNITFSTLKSNWRKYTGDEEIKTSEQVETSKKDVEKARESTEKAKRKSKLSHEDKIKIVESSRKIVESLSSSYDNLNIRSNVKGAILIKSGTTTLAEFWIKAHKSSFNIRLKESTYEMFKDYLEGEGAKETSFFENDSCKYSVKGFEIDKLESIATTIIKSLSENLVTEKDEETEEEDN